MTPLSYFPMLSVAHTVPHVQRCVHVGKQCDARPALLVENHLYYSNAKLWMFVAWERLFIAKTGVVECYFIQYIAVVHKPLLSGFPTNFIRTNITYQHYLSARNFFQHSNTHGFLSVLECYAMYWFIWFFFRLCPMTFSFFFCFRFWFRFDWIQCGLFQMNSFSLVCIMHEGQNWAIRFSRGL